MVAKRDLESRFALLFDLLSILNLFFSLRGGASGPARDSATSPNARVTRAVHLQRGRDR